MIDVELIEKIRKDLVNNLIQLSIRLETLEVKDETLQILLETANIHLDRLRNQIKGELK